MVSFSVSHGVCIALRLFHTAAFSAGNSLFDQPRLLRHNTRQQMKSVSARTMNIHRAAVIAVDDAFLRNDDLTKEELALRFTDVMDHYRESKALTNETVCLNMLRTRLPDLHLNRCFIAPSTIAKAGRGLFASRNVQEEELITLYPGDALLKWEKGVGNFSGDVGVTFGIHIQGSDRDANRVSTDEARSYEIKLWTNHSLVADPLRIDDAAYSGHMINDGSFLLSKSNSSRTLYSRETFKRHNAAFHLLEGCHLAVIATRAISKGDEILVSYGEAYWLSRSTSTNLAPSSKRDKLVNNKKRTQKKSTRKKKKLQHDCGGSGFG
mmetsp:Transcript_40455/g.47339  ORF Transcript_40455/g.47339 Transcript_40455/m.47339 type:complete len:323 (+) Transcript_40455:56-1024(+)|eukprot:CAMPEP_0194358136 /NCGR_PEP_ID=MMETSP0174-20130528/5456_1 /TAXON_ID=216777 /ORGANISM="Proboscia alata, Strain PI-D3" /LENGTH=322 /DNA_ID=CAMNT_0039128379 /DNA_START=41 /DNA_END=1009 /DNA_ORIENTATION=+